MRNNLFFVRAQFLTTEWGSDPIFVTASFDELVTFVTDAINLYLKLALDGQMRYFYRSIEVPLGWSIEKNWGGGGVDVVVSWEIRRESGQIERPDFPVKFLHVTMCRGPLLMRHYKFDELLIGHKAAKMHHQLSDFVNGRDIFND